MYAGTFASFVKGRKQRPEIVMVVCMAVLSGLLVGWLYPFPATMADSHNYVTAAIEDRFQIYRPFGYSFFLQVIHTLTPNIGFVFWSQHLLYTLSVLWFVLSTSFFFGKERRSLYLLFVAATLITPVYWYISNTIMSDSLFASLSILWFTSILWIAMGKRILFFSLLQAALLFAMLHTRYIALFYPLLSITLYIWLYKSKAWIPVTATLVALLLFYAQTEQAMAREARIKQFSTGFTGWQLANNALHVIPHIEPKKNLFNSKKLNMIHAGVSLQRDTITDLANNKVTSVFMWDNRLPLKQYMLYLKEKRGMPYLIAWIYAGKDLGEYGRGLIAKYPLLFVRYYLLPNTWNALWVQPGMVSRYEDHPKLDILNKWFSPTIEKGSYKANGDLFERLSPYLRPLSLAGWLLLAAMLVRAFIRRRALSPDSTLKKPWFWFVLAFAAAYFGAVVWASPIEARYFMPLIPIKAMILYLLFTEMDSGTKKSAP